MKRVILPIFLLLIALSSGLANAEDSKQPVVRIITSNFVLPAKFQAIRPMAEAAGVTLETVNIEKSDQAPEQWVEKADFIVLDVPRPSDRQVVEEALDKVLKTSQVPYVTIGGGPPNFVGMSPPQAFTLIGYYAGGGQENFTNFFKYISVWKQKGDLTGFPPPVKSEKTGFYHPKAPHVFSTFDDFSAWGSQHWPKEAGRVGYIIHSKTISNMETRALDRVIEATEAKGLVPIVFWFDNADDHGLAKIAKAAHLDAIVNLTHMMNGTARKKEFAELDIPVIQTLTFRDGGIPEWTAAVSGIAARTAAVFLAGPEGWGMSDPIVLTVVENGAETVIPEQLDALVGKLQNLVALRKKPASEKKLALLFWNYPFGEKNMAASNLNVPRSVETVTSGLKSAGYDVDPLSEQEMIDAGQVMLGALYRTVSLEDLLKKNLAVLLPVAAYQNWLDSLPKTRQQEYAHWGDPKKHWAVRNIDGIPSFIIPAFKRGNLLIMPQMPRADKMGAHYHDKTSPPDHLYMAAYLYLRENYHADALIHFGTHGTQEWLPGKDRGLSAYDDPFIAVGNVPVFYPYIQDNVGEALQARRRGRAITISHQTPPFTPSGLYDELRDIHHLVHEYVQLDEGAVKEKTAKEIADITIKAKMNADLGWDEKAVREKFDEFLPVLHDHLHELARSVVPLGLHRFGTAADPDLRLITVMQQLGEPFYKALDVDLDEPIAEDPDRLKDSSPFKTLKKYLRDGADRTGLSSELSELLKQADKYDAILAQNKEMSALLSGLEGRLVLPGTGGDPIRDPNVESGRNIYAFEADRVPTRAAYEAGGEAFDQLLKDFAKEHDGAFPKKLAFSLWSSETVRHMGVTEAQVLHALGLKPVWDDSGRVSSLEIIPQREMGRARVDVVIQATSVYRDQFDSFMLLLAEAIERIAALDEPNNVIATNTNRIAEELIKKGVASSVAQEQARFRIFSNAPGSYGTGLPDLTLKSTQWDKDDKLADVFLQSTRFAYGTKAWGVSSGSANLFAEQLKGSEAAIMSRSSNLHGVLSTDHPFEFLGGLSLAIRTLDGKSPSLYISDLRSGKPATSSLAKFLSNEMRVRYLNPQWIEGMKAEGYSGTLAMLNVTNNLFGWQVVDPSTVRADQWQAMFDTYVADKRNLDLNAFFEKYNPTAQAQLMERMVEAIRKGYWDAPEETRRELVERWNELATKHDVNVGETETKDFVAKLAQGFGLDVASQATQPASEPQPPSKAEAQPSAKNAQQIKGQELTQVAEKQPEEKDWQQLFALLTLVGLVVAGAGYQWQTQKMRKPL